MIDQDGRGPGVWQGAVQSSVKVPQVESDKASG